MKIWIFGQSMCLPYRVEEYQAWPYLLSQKLKNDLHLNSTGHQMWADLLLEQIQK